LANNLVEPPKYLIAFHNDFKPFKIAVPHSGFLITITAIIIVLAKAMYTHEGISPLSIFPLSILSSSIVPFHSGITAFSSETCETACLTPAISLPSCVDGFCGSVGGLGAGEVGGLGPGGLGPGGFGSGVSGFGGFGGLFGGFGIGSGLVDIQVYQVFNIGNGWQCGCAVVW